MTERKGFTPTESKCDRCYRFEYGALGLLVPAPARAEDVAVVARHGGPQRLSLHPDGPGVPRLGDHLLHRPGFVVLLQHVSGGAAVK